VNSDIIVEKHWGLQQRELLPTFTTFPFNPSINGSFSGNPTDTNEVAKIGKCRYSMAENNSFIFTVFSAITEKKH